MPYSFYEMNDNIIQSLSLVAQLGTILVTVYFTHQLVQNDNNREKRNNEEKLIKKFKPVFKSALIQDLKRQERGYEDLSFPFLVNAFKEIYNLHKKEVDLIFEAYHEYYLENIDNTFNPTLLTVQELMKKHNINSINYYSNI